MALCRHSRGGLAARNGIRFFDLPRKGNGAGADAERGWAGQIPSAAAFDGTAVNKVLLCYSRVIGVGMLSGGD